MSANLLLKLTRRLYSDPTDQQAFTAALLQPQPFAPCILWCRDPEEQPFTRLDPLPWQPPFVDRLAPLSHPGKHSLHDRGYYYCLDFSSVFAASILLAIPQSRGIVWDLCAAPGGKSVFAWRGLQPEFLVCNEVIGKRLGALLSNLKRCQVHPVGVLRQDVQILAENWGGTAAVVIVDAPCTGQSLLAKGEKAEGCFHPTLIHKNAQRQRRILANAAAIVAPGGHLAYMTCTYSPEENEETVAWFLKKFPNFTAVPVAFLQDFQSHLSPLPCYRLMPQTCLGAGAFTVLFHCANEGMPSCSYLPEELFDRFLYCSSSKVEV